MSHIEDLIVHHCPNGVEFKALKDVAKIIRGERVTKTELLENGKYPVVSGGTGYMGYLDRYNREPQTITIAQYGSAGYVNWQTENFWANDICFSVIPNKNVVLNRYLYFFLSSKQAYLYKISNRNAIPYSIQRERILEIKIPVPPLEVQDEIVRILDSYTQLEQDLESELEAELEARRQQYEHYRDSLLSLENLTNRLGEDNVKLLPLGQIGKFTRGTGLQKKDFSDSGFGCIHYGQIYTQYGISTRETYSYVHPESFNKFRHAATGDVLIVTLVRTMRI